MWKKAKENEEKWIRVFGHEYACASQLYAYAHFEYVYAFMKHAHTYMPRNTNPAIRIEKLNETRKLTT